MTEMERNSGGTMAGAGLADIQAEIWDLFHAGKKKEANDLFMRFLLAARLNGAPATCCRRKSCGAAASSKRWSCATRDGSAWMRTTFTSWTGSWSLLKPSYRV